MSRVPADPWLGFRICFLLWPRLFFSVLTMTGDLDRICLYSAVLKFLRSEKPPVSKLNYGGAPVLGKFRRQILGINFYILKENVSNNKLGKEPKLLVLMT